MPTSYVTLQLLIHERKLITLTFELVSPIQNLPVHGIMASPKLTSYM